nr:hypothetical protein [Tanacetum cinerariifolium]
MNSSEPSPSCTPTKVEVPKELPTASMVNTSLKKLKTHLAGFDMVVKERTMAIAITEGMRGFEHTKSCFRDEIIPFVKALKEKFNKFDQYLIDELTEVQNDKVKKDIDEIETINIELDHRVSKLIAENEHLKQTYKQLYDSIKPTRVRSKDQCDALINQVNQKSVEIFDLNANLQEKSLIIAALKDEFRKLKGKALVDNDVTTHTIALEMFKIVETQTDSSSNLVSNKPTLSSIGVKPSTSSSGSQPSGNTKKDKIHPLPSSTQKNKVEAYPRTVKSSLKNKNCVVEPKGAVIVQHFKLNANSKLICVKCNGCILSDTYDLCVLNVINDVNARPKSIYVKKTSKRKVWKPTGKVFTKTVPYRKPIVLETDTAKHVVTVVYSWKPKKSKTNVPVSKSKIIKSIFANNEETSKSYGSIVFDVPYSSLDECKSSKLFSGTVKFGNDHLEKIMGYGDYQIGNVTISKVYYVEGLRHNSFFVRQLCDSNLEVAFRQHTYFIRNLEGVDLLTGSRGNNLYTLSLGDMMASSLMCLL